MLRVRVSQCLNRGWPNHQGTSCCHLLISGQWSDSLWNWFFSLIFYEDDIFSFFLWYLKIVWLLPMRDRRIFAIQRPQPHKISFFWVNRVGVVDSTMAIAHWVSSICLLYIVSITELSRRTVTNIRLILFGWFVHLIPFENREFFLQKAALVYLHILRKGGGL